MKTRKYHFQILILSAFLLVVFSVSCSNSTEGRLIITQVLETGIVPGKGGSDFQRYVQGAQIVMLNPEKPAAAKILTKDFYSACSPDVSWDGKHMLFAAQQKEHDVWQIWEMDLRNKKYRQITSSSDNCIDPVHLPIGRLVFSKKLTNDSLKSEHALFVGNLDGSGMMRITFQPHSDLAATVMKDGRILAITQQLFPAEGDQIYITMRPDGTKGDLFYKGDKGSSLFGRGRDNQDGNIFFTETDSTGTKADVVSISYNRPLESRVNLTGSISGSFKAVFPSSSGKLLVCYNEAPGKPFALYEFDVNENKLGKRIYGKDDVTVIGVIQVSEYERPKKLPTEVDMEVKTGLIMCQDINFTGLGLASEASLLRKVKRFEVLGVDSSYGIIHVEDDGSFYLKILADKPFRFQKLDDNGKAVGKPCAWLWLRPNERRGCIGCHEDRNLVPENIVSLAVKKDPVIIPKHIEGIGEKEVELE